MHPASAPTPDGLSPADAERIRSGCSHAIVPLEPAMRGYRYVDLGGSEPPFYIARIRSGDFAATPSQRTCGWCDYAAMCPSRAR